MKFWQWTPPASHGNQTRLSWLVEQTAIVLLHRVARRAYRSGDMQTFNRIFTIAEAGQAAEQEARS